MSNLHDNTYIHDVRDRLQAVLSDVPVGLAWANIHDGRIVFINNKFSAMFGYELNDLSTVKAWIANCYRNPEQAAAIQKFWANIDDLEEKQQFIEEVELDIYCKNGKTKTVLSGKILLPKEGWAISTFVDITDRKQQEAIVLKQAMEKSLAYCKANNTALGLLMMDLDGFKEVNDTYGHQAGDELLQQVTRCLQIAVRVEDCLCRVGGDEFAVVITSLGKEKSVTRVAARIIDCMKPNFLLADVEVTMSISVGISVFPQDGDDEEILFKKADAALYRAKAAGKGSWSR